MLQQQSGSNDLSQMLEDIGSFGIVKEFEKLFANSATINALQELGRGLQLFKMPQEMTEMFDSHARFAKEMAEQFNLFKLSPEMENLKSVFESCDRQLPAINYEALLPAPRIPMPNFEKTIRQVIREELRQQTLITHDNTLTEQPLYGSDGIKRRPGFAG